jgi:DUF1680 family protein
MRKHFSLYLLLLIYVLLTANIKLGAQSLTDPSYREVALGRILPKGWLLDQLMIMNAGSSGHLDEIHPKIGHDNGWLGGRGDGWEETPYWLDGAVPLAYLVNDEKLKAKVLRYINWTLDHQRPSGYFGPITKTERENNREIAENNCEEGEDWWPKMVMLKVLQQYFSATGDKRVIPFMLKYFRYQDKVLKKCPIGKWTEWAQSRGAENVMMIQWLYSITNEPFLIPLANKIESQSFSWTEWFGNRSWVMNAAANQTGDKWMQRHAVNVGMALKSPAINYQRTGDTHYLEALKTGWNDLMLLHGLPMGIFSGDEDLHGNDPTQGVELCAIVESMFSLEQIIAITGDTPYMDALERMTFNALPAQTTDDYNMKQYFQIANQVQVSRGVFDFSLPFERGMNNVFGLRSGYTCCTANMHQGWTKFASHLWYNTKDNGLAALMYSPCEISTRIGNSDVQIAEVTDYPFEDKVRFNFKMSKPAMFPLELRIPSWCTEGFIELNGQRIQSGKRGEIVRINHEWRTGDQVVLNLPMTVTTSNWAKNSRAVERGPLVYALKVDERWEKGNDPEEGDYFSVYPNSDWKYGLLESAIQNPAEKFNVHTKPVTPGFVWTQKKSPLSITVQAKKIPGWTVVNGVAHQPVSDRSGVYKGEVDSSETEIILIPYGFSKVRIVAFPVVK